MKLINVTQNGVFDISSLVTKVTWGGDIRQVARRLTVTMPLTDDAYYPKYNVPLGSILIFKTDEDREILRAVVFDINKSTSGSTQIVAYDHLKYLLSSRGTYRFSSMTAGAIIKKLCSEFQIPVGNIPDTGITLSKLLVRDETIYDICVMALTETTKRNNKKYMLRMKEGKLNVIEKGAQTVRWLITEVQNLMTTVYSESISEMRNRIVVVGDQDKVLATIEDTTLIKQYGVLQDLKRESEITTGEAQTIAKNLLKELGRVGRKAEITCLGLDDVEAGTAIEVQESLTGLTGTFYVDTDEHTFENNTHTMRLKLNWTDEVAMKDAPEDAERKSGTVAVPVNINWKYGI
jgi:hypothetical protein